MATGTALVLASRLQPAICTGGTVSLTMRVGDGAEARRRPAVAVEHHRLALVAAGGHGGFDGHLPEQGHADLVGQRLTAARRRTARTSSPWSHVNVAHVLDDAGDAQEAPPGHVGGPDRDLLGGHAPAS